MVVVDYLGKLDSVLMDRIWAFRVGGCSYWKRERSWNFRLSRSLKSEIEALANKFQAFGPGIFWSS